MNIHQILDDLKAEFSRLDGAIAALEGSNVSSHSRRGRPPKSASHARTMSPAARKRISAAMKLRWAQRTGRTPAKKATKRTCCSKADEPCHEKEAVCSHEKALG